MMKRWLAADISQSCNEKLITDVMMQVGRILFKILQKNHVASTTKLSFFRYMYPKITKKIFSAICLQSVSKFDTAVSSQKKA